MGERGRVLLTDGDFEVLGIADDNIKLNKVQEVANAALLAWDDSSAADRILNEYSNNNTTRKGFDIIIGSDCLYSGMAAVKLLFSMVSLMLAENPDIESRSDPQVHTSYSNSNDNNSSSSNNDSENNIDDSNCRNKVFEDNCDNDDNDDNIPTSMDGGGWMILEPDRTTDINNTSCLPKGKLFNYVT